ncbi:hypothetical protein [Candidatus Bathycorpusculum sp.]
MNQSLSCFALLINGRCPVAGYFGYLAPKRLFAYLASNQTST